MRDHSPLYQNFMANIRTTFLSTLGLTLNATGTLKILQKNYFCTDKNNFSQVVYIFAGVAEKRLYPSSNIS